MRTENDWLNNSMKMMTQEWKQTDELNLIAKVIIKNWSTIYNRQIVIKYWNQIITSKKWQ
jgi:hypothetical protein